MNDKNRVCPIERAGRLDSKIRNFIQNPYRILRNYIRPGMNALDIGPGPGYFTIPMAEMLGASGKVIAADLQQGMLDKLKNKITGTEFEQRIILHKCDADKIGVTDEVDFILAFYVVHEVPDAGKLFSELHTILKKNGKILIVEPPGHVSKNDFEKMAAKAEQAGFIIIEKPRIFLGRTVVLMK
ncbi:MAG: class I SAM-dependent methyltransferase [Ignavibacteria bacterium]